jgi:DNA-binding winged helix-turn-helix (wHTH) protein
VTYRDEELPRDARRGDGVVLVDTTGRVVWWSAAVEAAVERVGLRWSRGMQCCQGLGCTDDAGGCLTAQALAAPDGLESRPWRGEAGGEALEGSVRARTIRTGGQDMVAFELVFRNAAGESAAAAHDVTVHALGRLSVSVSGKSRDGDWLQQRPGQVLRYLLASRGAAQRSEAIASALWPERGPSAVANVRYCIFKLREQLGERGETADSLITRDAAGYRIDLRRVELDVDAFQAKSVAGIAAQRRGEAAQGEALLGHALELYRGEFLADDPYADWAFS